MDETGREEAWRLRGITKNWFALCAVGDYFDASAFVESSSLPNPTISITRERAADKAIGKKAQIANQLVVVLGQSCDLDMQEQEAIAVDFLICHHDELRRLKGFGVDHVRLCIQPWLKLPRNAQGFGLSPSLQLLRLLAELGIELSIAVELWRDESFA